MTEQMMLFHDHPLSFTKFDSYHCNICAEKGGLFFYCRKCHYSRHKSCHDRTSEYSTDLPEQQPWHEHPLSCEEFKTYVCSFCHESNGFGYHCKECSFAAHDKCISSLNNPSLCKHTLKIYERGSLKYPDGECHFCQESILDDFLIHCSICNIFVDEICMKSQQQQLTLYNPKTHEHKLILLVRLVTFTCNGCGLEGDRNPYVCLECNFMMHQDCVDLPRVISINRHDHRISRTFHLGYGDWECGVCREKINWVYGGFTCLRCPSYAAHSICATRYDVWDGLELEDEPEEEDVEDPFEVINENEIIHFSHEKHHLKLHEDYVKDHDNIRCICCVIPINDAPFYKCVECDFYLHKTCASLPRKKRHFLHNHKLTLEVFFKGEMFKCSACNQLSNGFRYICNETNQQRICGNTAIFDVRCVSISEPFHHELHSHPLYHISTIETTCRGCGTNSSYVLSCTICDYNVCMKCAALPRKIKNRVDDHFLSLCHGAGNASGDLWCDICETKTDPSVWYYTCDKCGLSLHVKCVLGDLYYTKPGYSGYRYLVLPNNGVSRPVCSICEGHCRFPFFLLDDKGRFPRYVCSFDCRKNENTKPKMYEREI